MERWVAPIGKVPGTDWKSAVVIEEPVVGALRRAGEMLAKVNG
jgi:hypothetical protein